MIYASMLTPGLVNSWRSARSFSSGGSWLRSLRNSEEGLAEMEVQFLTKRGAF